MDDRDSLDKAVAGSYTVFAMTNCKSTYFPATKAFFVFPKPSLCCVISPSS